MGCGAWSNEGEKRVTRCRRRKGGGGNSYLGDGEFRGLGGLVAPVVPGDHTQRLRKGKGVGKVRARRGGGRQEGGEGEGKKGEGREPHKSTW